MSKEKAVIQQFVYELNERPGSLPMMLDAIGQMVKSTKDMRQGNVTAVAQDFASNAYNIWNKGIGNIAWDAGASITNLATAGYGIYASSGVSGLLRNGLLEELANIEPDKIESILDSLLESYLVDERVKTSGLKREEVAEHLALALDFVRALPKDKQTNIGAAVADLMEAPSIVRDPKDPSKLQLVGKVSAKDKQKLDSLIAIRAGNISKERAKLTDEAIDHILQPYMERNKELMPNLVNNIIDGVAANPEVTSATADMLVHYLQTIHNHKSINLNAIAEINAREEVKLLGAKSEREVEAIKAKSEKEREAVTAKFKVLDTVTNAIPPYAEVIHGLTDKKFLEAAVSNPAALRDVYRTLNDFMSADAHDPQLNRKFFDNVLSYVELLGQDNVREALVNCADKKFVKDLLDLPGLAALSPYGELLNALATKPNPASKEPTAFQELANNIISEKDALKEVTDNLMEFIFLPIEPVQEVAKPTMSQRVRGGVSSLGAAVRDSPIVEDLVSDEMGQPVAELMKLQAQDEDEVQSDKAMSKADKVWNKLNKSIGVLLTKIAPKDNGKFVAALNANKANVAVGIDNMIKQHQESMDYNIVFNNKNPEKDELGFSVGEKGELLCHAKGKPNVRVLMPLELPLKIQNKLLQRKGKSPSEETNLTSGEILELLRITSEQGYVIPKEVKDKLQNQGKNNSSEGNNLTSAEIEGLLNFTYTQGNKISKELYGKISEQCKEGRSEGFKLDSTERYQLLSHTAGLGQTVPINDLGGILDTFHVSGAEVADLLPKLCTTKGLEALGKWFEKPTMYNLVQVAVEAEIISFALNKVASYCYHMFDSKGKPKKEEDKPVEQESGKFASKYSSKGKRKGTHAEREEDKKKRRTTGVGGHEDK
jgi:hypothetical protein